MSSKIHNPSENSNARNQCRQNILSFNPLNFIEIYPLSVHLSFKPCLSNIYTHTYDLYSIQNPKFIFNPVTAKDKQKLNISISFQHEPLKRKQKRETK